MFKVKIDVNLADLMRPNMHGTGEKTLIVLHETISSDVPGLADINGVAGFLASKGYGIHGIVDAEGNKAWARGLGNGIFWQAGGVNTESIGIEQVFKGAQGLQSTVVKDKLLWAVRDKELRATAQLIAAACRAWSIPLVYSNSTTPGVTSHWDVSQHNSASEGHWDCHPVHKGGYYPMLSVIQLAKKYALLGYQF